MILQVISIILNIVILIIFIRINYKLKLLMSLKYDNHSRILKSYKPIYSSYLVSDHKEVDNDPKEWKEETF